MRGFSKILILLLFNFSSPFVYKGFSENKLLFIIDSIPLLLDEANSVIDAGNYEEALRLVKKIHNIRLNKIRPNDPKIALSYINLVYAYTMVADYDSAKYFLNKAEELYTTSQIKEGPELFDLYSNMGLINKYTGDNLQSEKCYLLAIEYFKRYVGNLNKEDLCILYMRLASIESKLKKYSEALIYYEKSRHLLEYIKDSKQLKFACYIGTASVYSEMQQYEKSIEILQTALNLLLSDSNASEFQLGILNNNLGNNYLKLNEFGLAQEHIESALLIYRNASLKGNNIAKAYETLGNLSEKKNDFPKALEAYRKALQSLLPRFIPSNDLANPAITEIYASPLIVSLLKTKINCLYNYYRKTANQKYLEASINTSLLAIQIAENLRNSYQNYESKLQVANDGNDLYNTALMLLKEAFDVTGKVQYNKEAFLISEKSKSAILLSALQEIDAKKYAGIPDSLLGEEVRLARMISLYKEKIHLEVQDETPDKSKIKKLEGYLFDAQQKHSILIQTFENKYPKYFELKYSNAIQGVDELKKQLPGNTSIIEYTLDDSLISIFLISQNSFICRTVCIDSTFHQLLSNYISGFHNFDFSRQSYSDYTQFCWNSNSLYNILFKPIAKYIRGDNLVIIPDGALSNLPFETLISEIPKDIPSTYYKALQYLLYDFTISYAYSSTLYLQASNDKHHTINTKLLAIAPEYNIGFNPDDYREKFVSRNKFQRNLFPIPGVIDEVNAIISLIPGDVYIGKNASEGNFKRIVENYDILHLAMHAVIDDSSPLFSKLVFSPLADSLEDGLLTTLEIFGLNLNARMVVLSACSTGEGNYSNGEGVMSLARGFAYAGSPSLIMTMWEVEDKSGSMMMKSFYENLLKGQSKAEALRNAKINYLQHARPENIHPFFWSSYVVMGNTQPLYEKRKFMFPVIIGILSVFTLAMLTYLVLRRTKKF
jgi:CHAT domain-containing protein